MSGDFGKVDFSRTLRSRVLHDHCCVSVFCVLTKTDERQYKEEGGGIVAILHGVGRGLIAENLAFEGWKKNFTRWRFECVTLALCVYEVCWTPPPPLSHMTSYLTRHLKMRCHVTGSGSHTVSENLRGRFCGRVKYVFFLSVCVCPKHL